VVENKWCRNLIINFPKPFCYPNTQFGEISGLGHSNPIWPMDLPIPRLIVFGRVITVIGQGSY